MFKEFAEGRIIDENYKALKSVEAMDARKCAEWINCDPYLINRIKTNKHNDNAPTQNGR